MCVSEGATLAIKLAASLFTSAVYSDDTIGPIVESGSTGFPTTGN
jgi:hypothetical protein